MQVINGLIQATLLFVLAAVVALALAVYGTVYIAANRSHNVPTYNAVCATDDGCYKAF